MIMSFDNWFDKYGDLDKYNNAYEDYVIGLAEDNIFEPMDYYEFMLDEYESQIDDMQEEAYERLKEERRCYYD